MVHFQYEWPKQTDIDRLIFLRGTKENNPGRFLVNIGLDISNRQRAVTSVPELSGATMFFAINLPLPHHVLEKHERGKYQISGLQWVYEGRDAHRARVCHSGMGSE